VACSAVILAGGNSVRFKRPKGLAHFQGKPIIQHIVETVSAVADEVLFVLHDSTQRRVYAPILAPHVTTVLDESEVQSPLVGVFTGLRHATRAYSLVTACDTPRISAQVLTYLLNHAPGYDAVIARWPNDYIEPLQAVYRTESASRSATTTLRAGQLRMRDMIRRLPRPRYISTDALRALDPRLDTYHNVNTPDDLRALEARFHPPP
jgi:molybdopterin-guanine dinucleotide biosynthesis protein A